jgi:hypothetical protein
MMYRPMPYPPPFDGGWTRSIAPWDGGGGRPGRPWTDGGPLINRGPVSDDWGDFNPFDPRPNGSWRGGWGDSPMGGPGAMGRGPSAPLSPSDFGAPPPSAGDASASRIIEQLSHCSVALKRCGERLTRATTDGERREASVDGYGAVSYLLGVLSTQGISLPPTVLGDSSRGPGDPTRGGDSCKQAGEWVDRMIDKYSRGTRGVFGDIGEGIDKVGGCVKETRDNLSK